MGSGYLVLIVGNTLSLLAWRSWKNPVVTYKRGNTSWSYGRGFVAHFGCGIMRMNIMDYEHGHR